jgi:hypothetical protein
MVKTMNVSTTTALIGFAGVIFGAVAAFSASYFQSKSKLEELAIQYEYNLKNKYLENARNHIIDLYIPLNIAISKVYYSYIEFRDLSRIHNNEMVTTVKAAYENFKVCFNSYENAINSLRNDGLDSYLIFDLEEKILYFKNLISNSLNSTAIQIEKEILVTNFPMDFEMNTPFMKVKFFSQTKKRSFDRMVHKKVSVRLSPLALFGLNYEIEFAKKILSAPLSSKEFESQFIEYYASIKSGIKTVTLGKEKT